MPSRCLNAKNRVLYFWYMYRDKGDIRLKVAKAKSYRKNKDYYRRYHARRAEERAAFIAALKNHPCADCGGRFPPYCMDFDHLPQTDKFATVSQLIHMNGALDLIIAEVAKCQLVCANCHRIRTHRRRNEKKSEAQNASTDGPCP